MTPFEVIIVVTLVTLTGGVLWGLGALVTEARYANRLAAMSAKKAEEAQAADRITSN